MAEDTNVVLILFSQGGDRDAEVFATPDALKNWFNSEMSMSLSENELKLIHTEIDEALANGYNGQIETDEGFEASIYFKYTVWQ